MKAGEIYGLFLINKGEHEEVIPVLKDVLKSYQEKEDLKHQEATLINLFDCYTHAETKDSNAILQAGMEVLNIQIQRGKDPSESKWTLSGMAATIEALPEIEQAQKFGNSPGILSW